ncbi:hypothetical protein L228DRAFT_271099 [Xylona heveae TC161]|uniref:Uncharacterized protein n=1 Tax=Xylona heveae (strain CBS 132557 / TC161) TaxID=1328760 RepID=A0A165A0K2_XYLHT|nr:hypothetical protein L228DRAFT_271099 [Xylona heveae TC161]KZF19779.1 hypothetical protein L228DRAFT_271099 [Xylona heveae TC161]
MAYAQQTADIETQQKGTVSYDRRRISPLLLIRPWQPVKASQDDPRSFSLQRRDWGYRDRNTSDTTELLFAPLSSSIDFLSLKMLLQSIRASRSTLARAARQQVTVSRRTFVTPTAVRYADLVQDLYLKELKAYKPAPAKASDAEAHVQKFTPPKAPQSPEESNIASELKAYEDQEVDIEGQQTGEVAAKEEDWFEEEEEEAAAAH